MTPRQAYERLVAGDVETVSVDKLANRVAANAIMPYPPGIPMLMSGENFGGSTYPRSATCAACKIASSGFRVSRVSSKAPSDRWNLSRALRESLAVGTKGCLIRAAVWVGQKPTSARLVLVCLMQSSKQGPRVGTVALTLGPPT